jgi:hypothetical protein
MRITLNSYGTSVSRIVMDVFWVVMLFTDMRMDIRKAN